MTQPTDKGLEAAARALARLSRHFPQEEYAEKFADEHWDLFVDDVKAAITAYLASLPTGAGWQPIATAPKDESTFIAAIEVSNSRTGKKWWDYALMYFSEGEFKFNNDADTGWNVDDYTLWRPLGPPPHLVETKAEK